MNKFSLKRIIPFALTATIMLSGCSKKSECEIPTSHVHKYTKQVTDDITIERYLDNESLNYWGYIWTADYIEVNKVDEKIFSVLESKGLFDGATNWNYLFNVMASKHDYLMFYYYYETTETVTVYDDEGNIDYTYDVQVPHDGWTSNPYDSDNTGDIRLYHHRFYSYKVINENGNFKLEKSPEVDDIREVLEEYPYTSEDFTTIVYYSDKFNKFDLPKLSPEFFNIFKGPDLSNSELNNGNTR